MKMLAMGDVKCDENALITIVLQRDEIFRLKQASPCYTG
jgi:hypothetical protein